MAAAITTLAVCFFYLLAQMAGAGGLVSLLLGINDRLGQSIVVGVVGILMIIYVLIGGMKGTTWVQIVKAFLLIGGAIAMTIWVLAINGFNINTLLESAVAALRRRTRRTRSSARGCSTARTRGTSSRWRSRSCSAPPACRTC